MGDNCKCGGLEERVAQLEREVAELKRQVSAQPEDPRVENIKYQLALLSCYEFWLPKIIHDPEELQAALVDIKEQRYYFESSLRQLELTLP